MFLVRFFKKACQFLGICVPSCITSAGTIIAYDKLEDENLLPKDESKLIPSTVALITSGIVAGNIKNSGYITDLTDKQIVSSYLAGLTTGVIVGGGVSSVIKLQNNQDRTLG